MFSADLYARVRFLLVLFARETAGAARIRHSPRPLIPVARKFTQTPGASRRGIAKSCPSSSLRGALATKQSILPLCGAMDCFASLAMTARLRRLLPRIEAGIDAAL